MSENYIKDLQAQIKVKQKKLDELYEKRKGVTSSDSLYGKENWYNIQQGINIISVDIQTLKSRIDNYGKKVHLPDNTNVETIINQIK